MNAFLTDAEMASLVEAIKTAEEHSTGEIRIHIDASAKGHFARKALRIFRHYKMDETPQHNAVLFCINFEKHYLTIIGDRGIHKILTQKYWDRLHDELTAEFGKGNYFLALKKAVLETGEQLKKYFPAEGTKINNLPDEISFS